MESELSIMVNNLPYICIIAGLLISLLGFVKEKAIKVGAVFLLVGLMILADYTFVYLVGTLVVGFLVTGHEYMVAIIKALRTKTHREEKEVIHDLKIEDKKSVENHE